MLLFISLLLGCTPDKTIEGGSDTHKEIEKVSPIYWDDCSYNGGDHICNLRLFKANEVADDLYDHYGEVIAIDLSAMWCGPCQQAASEVESIKQQTGVKWVTVLIENEYGLPPSYSDGSRWANAFSLPLDEIWLGSRQNIDFPDGIDGFPLQGWPYFVILDTDLRIRVVIEGWNKQNMINKIEALQNE
jgi:thiol-disulfide isomerase/thioredoxin|tara:strand:+ start:149 stop:712 length:564 start_codon:yes stop_codon:yes gene_type:complete